MAKNVKKFVADKFGKNLICQIGPIYIHTTNTSHALHVILSLQNVILFGGSTCAVDLKVFGLPCFTLITAYIVG